MMYWKTDLLELEHSKQWDTAIAYMQNVIAENPDNMDAAICMNYLLMNLIVEEICDMEKFEYYQLLTKKYFQESYAKFSENAEYLFFTGITAYMSPWFFDLEYEEPDKLLEKARVLDESNLLYHWGYRSDIERQNDPEKKILAISILKNNEARTLLESKSAVGRYLLDHIIDAGESNKEKLCWLLDLYFSNQIDVSTLCYSCDDDYAKGLEGDVFNPQEERLFLKLMSLSRIFVESSKRNDYRQNFYFPEKNELHQVASQLREELKNNLEKICNFTSDIHF
ncbi:MAG TPA: hypothetical protein VGT41_04915 [Candidatus Babeliales bacterium]|nr:hypothetical protein [Candidatus Babeliales bacterium]